MKKNENLGDQTKLPTQHIPISTSQAAGSHPVPIGNIPGGTTFSSPGTTFNIIPGQEVVHEKIISERAVFPQVVNVMEKHTYTEPVVREHNLAATVTEVEKEIVHVQPMRMEKEVVHIHPTLVEKDILHVQPKIIHITEEVIHPEKVSSQAEEKLEEQKLERVAEQVVLAPIIEDRHTEVISEEVLQQNLYVTREEGKFKEEMLRESKKMGKRGNIQSTNPPL
jgi:hypothetical protein